MNSKLLVYGNEYGAFDGEVAISGAKNATLPLLAASVLTSEAVNLLDAPRLADVASMITIISALGSEVSFLADGSLLVQAYNLNQAAPSEWVKKIRASILLLGPMLARHGVVELALPGGCAIGVRPIMEHLTGLKALGAEISIESNKIYAKTNGLKGAHIKMRSVSVGATENIIMAATLADGETIIENAACEPEITDLILMLNKMGAKISGANTSVIKILGVPSLTGVKHRIMPDRIEAATFLVAATAARGRVLLKNYSPARIDIIIEYLRQAGASINNIGNDLELVMSSRPTAVSIETSAYPGFPTDLQAQWVALAAVSSGSCSVRENIFDDRFHHMSELISMGAKIKQDGDSLLVTGVERLKSASVTGSDLRATAGLVIAANIAQGRSEINNAHHLDRGYESFDLKFSACGAVMQRLVEANYAC